MKYEVIGACGLDGIPPPWTYGMDRLSYFSPFPGVRERLEEFVAKGWISRYVEHDDRVETFDDRYEVHTIYNTAEAAETIRALYAERPDVLWVKVVERPDLPDATV